MAKAIKVKGGTRKGKKVKPHTRVISATPGTTKGMRPSGGMPGQEIMVKTKTQPKKGGKKMTGGDC